MPALNVLPILLVKSSLLAIIAAYIAQYSKKVSLIHLAITVVAYQLIGGVAEYFMTSSVPSAMQDFTLGFPGMIIQILGGWFVLKTLANYEC